MQTSLMIWFSTRVCLNSKEHYTKGKDFKALCEELNFFRKTTKVGPLVDFVHHLKYDLYAGENHDRYLDYYQWSCCRSFTEFGLTVPLSKWCRRSQTRTGNSWIKKSISDGMFVGYKAFSELCRRIVQTSKSYV